MLEGGREGRREGVLEGGREYNNIKKQKNSYHLNSKTTKRLLKVHLAVLVVFMFAFVICTFTVDNLNQSK